MYDFDRVNQKTGQLRELHIQQSIDTVEVPFKMPTLNHKEWDVGDVHVTQFVMAEYFGVFKLAVAGKGNFENKDGKYVLLSVIDGQVRTENWSARIQASKGTTLDSAIYGN